MKLVHQINIAFGVAMVLVLSITAVLIHYVLLDHFIGTQKQDMKTMGSYLSANLQEVHSPTLTVSEALPVSIRQLSPAYANIQAIVSDENGNIVSNGTALEGTTAAKPLVTGRTDISTSFTEAPGVAGAVTSIQGEPVTGVGLKELWTGSDRRYLVEVSTLPQGKLTLLTPVSKIKEIEQALLVRLLLVFGVGGLLMLLFSLLITRKLIKPLMRLKEELQKVKGRQFSKVKLVKASGEIGSVAQTVYDMAGELNRFNSAQKQFFQNASHELKSPLMSIAGYAEGIRDGVFEGDSVRKGLDIILSESGRLRNIVTEMTLLAKLDSEEDIYKASPVNLKELILETTERMNPQLVKKDIQLHASYDELEQLSITADRDKLLQALINVVANAIRHADRNIYIHASVEKGQIRLTVSDDGKGIPEELLPYLFHRFVKGKDGDSGLGLAIARAIVERCGGWITADNRREGGAQFSFGFPVSV
ncbi:sensor histidine kinase [Paenibacillus sp. NPDC058174]|uniref:sensor histidine kinase n=1 Tax=Paenibacillus sp. NPDC058174 TaxID=3346366 RepID=UPI0036DE0A42